MEGRGTTAVRPGWHHESRHLYRKIGSSGQQARAYSHNQERETTKGSGGRGRSNKPVGKDSEKIFSSVIDLTEESTEVDKWIQNGCGQPLERSIVNNDDEEEDGVHGGRMKPLASFDVNRGLPPSQQGRKLRIKLSPPTENSAPTTDGAAPKAIRRAQDKENGGLVPLCPGTTQIRWMKRKSVSPTELKPQGSKRSRVPIGSENSTDRLSKMPAESCAPRSVVETEGDESNGMDLLLMALKAADPKCQRSISPSLPLARPTHVLTTNSELYNGRTTTKGGATMSNLYHPQAQTKVLKEDQSASREEDLKGSRCRCPLKVKCTMKAPQVTDPSCSDEVECSEEEWDMAHLKPHRYRPMCKEALEEEFERPGLKPHRYRPISKEASEDLRRECSDRRREHEESSDSDEDCYGHLSDKHVTRMDNYWAEREFKVKNNKEEELHCSDAHLDKYTRGPHQYRSAACKEASTEEMEHEFEAEKVEEAGPSCSDDDPHEYARKPHRHRAAEMKEVFDEANLLFKSKSGETWSTVGDSGKYNRKPLRHDHSPLKVERRKENELAKSSSGVLKIENGIKPLLSKLHPSEATVLLSQIRSKADEIGVRNDEIEEADDKPLRKPLSSKLVPSQAKVFLARLKSKVQSETRKDERVSDEADDEPVMQAHQKKPLRPQTNVMLSQDQNVNQRAQKDCHPQQCKVSEYDPTGYENCVGVSLLQQEGINQEGNGVSNLRKDSTWAKYPKQSTRKESSGQVRSASDQQRWDTRKRKGSDHISAFCIVPKQVKLSTASSLVETGEPSHPSVGSVVVECLPPSTTEQTEDNRVPFCEVRNRDTHWRHNPLHVANVKLAIDMRKWDTDKENRSRVAGTASDRAPSAGLKVSSTHLLERSTRAPNDVSSSHLSGSTSVVGVSGSRALGATFSENFLHPLQNSRIRLVQVGAKSSYSSDLQCGNGSYPHQQLQRRSSATLGAGLKACSRDEDNETRHEIAGITLQRRSWEALKATEYFAKKRFDSEGDVTDDKFNNRPSILSRYQNVQNQNQGVSISKSKLNFGTHLSQGAALSASLGFTTHGVATEIVQQRRGPKQSKQERLSTKVLNKNLENNVQLKDARSCRSGIDFDRLNPVETGVQFPANGYCSSQHPRSYSGLPKVPSLTTRQKRGRKKILKEMLKNIPTKTTSTCILKPLSEPSGLLGDFNPGIMQRVRNSEQIHAILGALIRAPSLPKVPQNRACIAAVGGEGECKEKTVPVQETLKKEELAQAVNGGVHRLTLGKRVKNEQDSQVQDQDLNEELLDQGHPLVAEQREPLEGLSKSRENLREPAGLVSLTDKVVNGDCRHDQSESLTQGLSSICRDPELAEDNELDLQPMSGTDCSPVAAGLAGRWLELLTLDINGRLTALRRSRLRVQSTLTSGELNPMSGSASVISIKPPSTKATIDMDPDGSQESVCSGASLSQVRGDESSHQMDRWRALFNNMDSVLGNEAAKLVSGDSASIRTLKFCRTRSSRAVKLKNHKDRSLYMSMTFPQNLPASDALQESWLWQIQQMQAFCPSSNQRPFSALEKANVVFCQGLATSNLEIERQPPERWPITIEAIEKELGFAASAASIRSTANFLTKVQSFS